MWTIDKYMFLEKMRHFVQEYLKANYEEGELDILRMIAYIDSPQFDNIKEWNMNTKEDCNRKINELIENGMPIWDFVRTSDEKKEIIKNDLQKPTARHVEKRPYKCYQDCALFNVTTLNSDLIERCMFRGKGVWRANRKGIFYPRKLCFRYISKIDRDAKS